MRLLLAGLLLTVVTFPAAGAGPWYYCDPLHAYYPYVGRCPVAWREVDPDPETDTPGQSGTRGQTGSFGQKGTPGQTGGYNQSLARPLNLDDATSAPGRWPTERPDVGEGGTAASPLSDGQISSGFLQGQADRESWEAWLGSQRGDYRAGAEYWAHYGATGAGSCGAAPPSAGEEWTAGCSAAQERLAASDERRQTEPQYRLGWDNPPHPASSRVTSDAPDTAPGPAPDRARTHDAEAASKVELGRLGAKVQEVTPEIAESLGLPAPAGALVASVTIGSTAERKGIKPGDVIEAYNGHNIDKVHDLVGAVDETPVGETIKVKLWRNGHELTLNSKITAGPANPAPFSGGMVENRTVTQVAPLFYDAPERRTPKPAAKLASSARPDAALIAQWQGDTRLTTRPFHVEGPWEIRWTTASGPFVIELDKLDGGSDQIANQTHKGSSSSFVPKGGDYFLKVIADRQWSIKAVNVPDFVAPDNKVPAADVGAVMPPEQNQAMPRQEPIVQTLAMTLPSPPPGYQNEPRHSHDEEGVIQAVHAAVAQFKSGHNQSQQGAARSVRAQAICRILPSHHVRNWVGTVESVAKTEKGRGVLSVQIAPDVVVRTWNNSLADAVDHTMIEPKSELFGSVSALHAGEKIVFSGTFPDSDTDCIEESGLDVHASITEPAFIMNFESVAPLQ